MHHTVRALLAGSALSLTACGHAQVLEQSYVDPKGGMLALHGSETEAMEDAQLKMTAHCGPGKFQIQKRAMAVVGTQAYSTTQTNYGEAEQGAKAGASETAGTGTGSTTENSELQQRDLTGGATTTTVSGVQEVRENRITYACLP